MKKYKVTIEDGDKVTVYENCSMGAIKTSTSRETGTAYDDPESVGGRAVQYTINGYTDSAPTTHLKSETISDFEGFAQELRDCEDYAWGWHCNLACMIMDCGVDRYTANGRAADFMKRAFKVDVRKFDWTGFDWSAKGKTFQKRIEDLDKITNIQVGDPLSKTDEYMRGLANGLLAAKSCFDDQNPEYIEAPEEAKEIICEPAPVTGFCCVDESVQDEFVNQEFVQSAWQMGETETKENDMREITYNLQGKKINAEFLSEIRDRFENTPKMRVGTDIHEDYSPIEETTGQFNLLWSVTEKGLDIYDDKIKINVINYDMNGPEYTREETSQTQVKNVLVIKGVKMSEQDSSKITEFFQDPTKTFALLNLPRGGDVEFTTVEAQKTLPEEIHQTVVKTKSKWKFPKLF